MKASKQVMAESKRRVSGEIPQNVHVEAVPGHVVSKWSVVSQGQPQKRQAGEQLEFSRAFMPCAAVRAKNKQAGQPASNNKKE